MTSTIYNLFCSPPDDRNCNSVWVFALCSVAGRYLSAIIGRCVVRERRDCHHFGSEMSRHNLRANVQQTASTVPHNTVHSPLISSILPVSISLSLYIYIYSLIAVQGLVQLLLHLCHVSLANAKQLIIIMQHHSTEQSRVSVASSYQASFMAISVSASHISQWFVSLQQTPLVSVLGVFSSICLSFYLCLQIKLRMFPSTSIITI